MNCPTCGNDKIQEVNDFGRSWCQRCGSLFAEFGTTFVPQLVERCRQFIGAGDLITYATTLESWKQAGIPECLSPNPRAE